MDCAFGNKGTNEEGGLACRFKRAAGSVNSVICVENCHGEVDVPGVGCDGNARGFLKRYGLVACWADRRK